ncbi:MAG: cysteine--tRNA ligase [Anaerolineae bacterium]|nr:cysteine--tRNA ligase [Anaerolineae bacterium]
MALTVYSTLSRRKEEFVPLEGNKVLMYVCGPNVYGPSHVGHAMSYVVFDVIRRYLEYRGYQVKHVQNFTDIEDRIIQTANALGVTVQDLAEKYIARFLQEADALNIQRAHHYPRATEVVPKIQEIVQALIAKGHAYELDGDVYFRISSKPDYGKLTRQSPEAMRAGARVEVDSRKENVLDFALWKAAKPGEPSWESPWGQGRPGWHIECSAMAMQFLGDQIDIHGGGEDVIFPHHEDEIAQSESYSGKVPFVKYWLHNGLLRPSADQEKMTRHLGNFISTEQALQQYNPDAIRLFILSSHYRSPVTWSEEGILGADRGLERLRTALKPASTVGQQGGEELRTATEEARTKFIEAMDDDFNTARAIGHLFDLGRLVNQARDLGVPAAALEASQQTVRELAEVLGLTLRETRLAVDPAPLRELAAAIRGELISAGKPALAEELLPESLLQEAEQEGESLIELLVTVRSQLRTAREYGWADRIRDELADLGIAVEDGSKGSTWRMTS